MRKNTKKCQGLPIHMEMVMHPNVLWKLFSAIFHDQHTDSLPFGRLSSLIRLSFYSLTYSEKEEDTFETCFLRNSSKRKRKKQRIFGFRR